ncbi:two-partner secretion domain-containing protein [Coleofasciculus sp. F4-SAH-05]|uniref:two-partner secretion domain-containing protein n=1 Tax=Coleofasciculus sp. F4-SAH-05 TaxID=3069525 RepID=UPI0032F354FE
MSRLKPIGCSIAIATALLSLSVDSKPIQAQSITPADGTNTIVTPDGNRIDISGGSLSGDGGNLFHRFEQFGVSQGEIANFLSNPEIRNILAGVVGGEASLINGLIQVTGGNSNLFLMNPAGIVFGTQASLNVPAAFTATTASSIGFDGGQFNTVGDNNYQALMGSPNAFSFAMEQPGSIINAGDLAVGEGQGLTVVAGNVINTGTFSAPGGTISVASVPGTSQVVINQENMALGLKLDVADLDDNGVGNISPASLGQLVTGGDVVPATEIQVDDQGQVWLAASNHPIPTETGTTIVSGSIDTASGETGGTVHILGQRVGLVDAEIDASGSNGGGTVLVGGDYQGQGEVFNAQRTFVNQNSTIQADALTNDDGGTVVLWANDTTQFFGDISSRGGAVAGNGGVVEVSGKENLVFEGTVDTSAINGEGGTLLLDPTDITITAGGTPGGFTGQVMFADAEPTTISKNQLESLSGNTNVLVQADNTITIEPMQDGALTFQPGSGSITFEAGGAFVSNSGIDTNTRDISITAGSITFNSNTLFDIDAGSLFSTADDSGSINLTSTSGDISFDGISTTSGLTGTTGDITISVSPGSSLNFETISTDSGSGQPFSDPLDATITINGIPQPGGTLTPDEVVGGVPTDGGTPGTDTGNTGSTGEVPPLTTNPVVNDLIAQAAAISSGDFSGLTVGSTGEFPALTTNPGLNNLLAAGVGLSNQINAEIVNAAIQITGANSNLGVNGAAVMLSTALGIQRAERDFALIEQLPRVPNSNMAVLEVLMNNEIRWDNLMESIRAREANQRALGQQLDADRLRGNTDYLLNQ